MPGDRERGTQPKVRRFDLVEPETLSDACSLLRSEPDARPIAGGTALVALLKLGLADVRMLVSLRRVHANAGSQIEASDGVLIPAGCTLQAVAEHPGIQREYPILARACAVVANIRIRNVATLGGNIAHADPQSDPPTALLALDAEVDLSTADSQRRIRLADFLRSTYESDLQRGEVVTAIHIPAAPRPTAWHYGKFTSRSSEDRPEASIATVVYEQDGVCEDVRIAVGGMTVARRITAAEEVLRGRPVTPSLIKEAASTAGARAIESMSPGRVRNYRKQLVEVLVSRALSAGVNS